MALLAGRDEDYTYLQVKKCEFAAGDYGCQQDRHARDGHDLCFRRENHGQGTDQSGHRCRGHGFQFGLSGD